MVKKYGLDIDDFEDPFGNDAAYQIELVFDWLNNKDTRNSTTCYDNFVTYKNEQKHQFTKEIKK